MNAYTHIFKHSHMTHTLSRTHACTYPQFTFPIVRYCSKMQVKDAECVQAPQLVLIRSQWVVLFKKQKVCIVVTEDLQKFTLRFCEIVVATAAQDP